MAEVTATPAPTATPGPTATPMPTEVPPLSEVMGEKASELAQSTDQLISSLPLFVTRLFFAAVAVLVGFLLLKFGRHLIRKLVHKKDKEAGRSYQQRETLRALLDSIFRYVMYFTMATVVLSIFGVNVSSLIAVAGVGGVAIGFGAQTLVKDIISGAFLWTEGNVSVGDTIEVNGLTGVVETISLRTTSIRDFNGSLYVVPNGDIRTVANMNRQYKRALVEVRLNYEDSLKVMLDILADEMQKSRDEVPGLREVPQVQGVTAMIGDAITVRIAALCDPTSVSAVERALRQRVIDRFETEEILLPHAPIMDTPRKKKESTAKRTPEPQEQKENS